MIGRRAVIGLSLLSALVFCAFAAPSAFAVEGTTGFTCVKVVTEGDWKDPHCTEKQSPGAGYAHAEIKEGTETSITVSNKNTANNTTEHTPAVLDSEPIGGSKIIVTCTEVHGTGVQTNTPGPPMNVSGTITVKFEKCTATLNTKACESVNEGKPIETKATTSTPTGAHEVKFDEHIDAFFAKFTVKCNKTNFPITVTGSATGIPKGTTIEFTKASTNELKVGGKVASFEGKFTPTMSTTEPGLALTTTAT